MWGCGVSNLKLIVHCSGLSVIFHKNFKFLLLVLMMIAVNYYYYIYRFFVCVNKVFFMDLIDCFPVFLWTFSSVFLSVFFLLPLLNCFVLFCRHITSCIALLGFVFLL